MQRGISIFGLVLLGASAVPFAMVTLIWLAFLATALLSPASWELRLWQSAAQSLGLMAAFWFGAFQVGTALRSTVINRYPRKRLPALAFGAVTLFSACILFWHLFRHDAKQLFPAELMLAAPGSIPLAFLSQHKKTNERAVG